MSDAEDSDAPTMSAPQPFALELRVPCASPAAAALMKSALDVDKELSPAQVTRTCAVQGSELCVNIRASELRLLRASAASFFDMVSFGTFCGGCTLTRASGNGGGAHAMRV